MAAEKHDQSVATEAYNAPVGSMPTPSPTSDSVPDSGESPDRPGSLSISRPGAESFVEPKPVAIETLYAGHLFRSRTEARWAVLFDALSIPWVYEGEGFELPHGRYLPDFYLPTLKAFFEVKGEEPRPNPDNAPRLNDGLHPTYVQMAELTEATRKMVVLAVGTPGPWGKAGEDAVGFPWSSYPELDGTFIGCFFDLIECRNPGCLRIAIGYRGGACLFCRFAPVSPSHQSKRILDAFVAARSARFEHSDKWRP